MILLLIVFCPIIAAIAVLAGAPARLTSLWASGLTLAASLFAFASLDRAQPGFSYVTSIPISTDWRLNFTLGLDGLSGIMVLLTAIVLLAAVWFTGKIAEREHAF
jgi:NADH:ubiquinone oxidoreductase subunit 4 (subunit M)